jgi:hypothetical protein
MTTPEKTLSRDLTGMVFGRLTVIGPAPRVDKKKAERWLCNCSCGAADLSKSKYILLRGESRSCGCLMRESSSRTHRKHGYGIRDANGKRSRTYEIWVAMRDRCNCVNHIGYPRYGGRGIKVCSRWDSFSDFIADMGECPPGLTIERINNAGNYEPGNCKWATYSEQRRNQERMKSTECLHGHLRTPENTGLSKRGTHFCRPCSRAAIRAWKEHKKKEKLNAIA